MQLHWVLSGLGVVRAVTFNFINECAHEIQVYDNTVTAALCRSTTLGLACFDTEPIRKQHVSKELLYVHDAVVVAEFSVDLSMKRVWYDVSIVPPGSESCTNLEECLRRTNTTGFNVPLLINPINYQHNVAPYNCHYRICYENGCPDAYMFPTDDIKTMNCPLDTMFDVTFCPDLPP
uniref:Secreted protein n=1 Tax=Achlya hypogyna TaxID=1202772 RepID=A0A0A7CMX6_ACHHY|nr:secreted protein [Achlya hypogyna]